MKYTFDRVKYMYVSVGVLHTHTYTHTYSALLREIDMFWMLKMPNKFEYISLNIVKIKLYLFIMREICKI